jgi:hypothetical protein
VKKNPLSIISLFYKTPWNAAPPGPEPCAPR